MSKKQIIGLLIFIVLIGGIFIANSYMEKDDNTTIINSKRDLTTVYVATGGGKEDFIQDEEVVKIIEEEYGLNVVYDSWSNGKLIVKELVREQGKNEYNAMFCSDQRFYDYYKLPADVSKGEAERKNVTSGGLILNTPIVIYSWGEIAEALKNQGIVEVIDGTYYITDMNKMIDLILNVTSLHKTSYRIHIFYSQQNHAMYYKNKTKKFLFLYFYYLLRIEFDNGYVYYNDRVNDLYMRGFLHDYYLRRSCHECVEKEKKRISEHYKRLHNN